MRHAAILRGVNYAEYPAPRELRHLAKAAWTLCVDGDESERVSHVATPDGCMEIVRRIRGRSNWGGEQPRLFVAGLTTRPARLSLSGNGQFVGLRLWPWTWNRIGAVDSALLVDRWADLSVAAPGFAMLEDPRAALASLDPRLLASETIELVDVILSSSSVGEIADRSGRPHRWLQRWFARNVGVPPGVFLRLQRFSTAFERLPGSADSLAGHAAEHGYSDQSHMAREFRSLSGSSAGSAKTAATGPFLRPGRPLAS